MVDDTHEHPNADSHERLRRSAKDLIDHGVPPPSRGGSLNAEALHLLYERARSPETAADALRLLHELQTYQVELDLLYEQLQANEHELCEELAHYRSLYERAPAIYLIVAADGEIIEANEAASDLFGESLQTLTGEALSALLAPGQEGTVNTLLRKSLEQKPDPQDKTKGSVELPDHRSLAISARSSAFGDSILVILTEAGTHSTTSSTPDTTTHFTTQSTTQSTGL